MYKTIYRVCQGLWPSLMFADEDIEPQNFWASSKSHVATTYLYMHLCSKTLVSPTKVSIMKLKSTLLNRMWQHDFTMKQIIFSLIFLSENTGQLAKQAGYPGHDPWHTRYLISTCVRMHASKCVMHASRWLGP